MKNFVWSGKERMIIEAQDLDKALEQISLMAEAEEIGDHVIPIKNKDGSWSVYTGYEEDNGIAGQGSAPYGYLWEEEENR